jgi:hexosaminidase
MTIFFLFAVTEEQKKLVLGGEACLFAEFVDKTNILPRLFPWVSAVAERLWSSGIDISTDATNYARNRLDQHRCRMLQ